MPPAWISLTLSRHISLSFIASGRSSGLHPVSSHSCCIYVLAGRPALAQPYVGVHRSISLMSSSLFLQQCPACLVRLTLFPTDMYCLFGWLKKPYHTSSFYSKIALSLLRSSFNLALSTILEFFFINSLSVIQSAMFTFTFTSLANNYAISSLSRFKIKRLL